VVLLLLLVLMPGLLPLTSSLLPMLKPIRECCRVLVV